MVNGMITTLCFSVCGYFNYPIIKNNIFKKFIEKVSTAEQLSVEIEFIESDRNSVNHTLLFELGNYSSFKSTNFNLLKSDSYTPMSIFFRNKYNVSSEIVVKPVDNNGFEIDYMLEKEELDDCAEKNSVIQEIARIFFETLQPLYGCCGTEMFTDGMGHIEEDDIINNKFYNIGYIGFHTMDKFDFISNTCNIEKYSTVPLQDGYMYINKNMLS